MHVAVFISLSYNLQPIVNPFADLSRTKARAFARSGLFATHTSLDNKKYKVRSLLWSLRLILRIL